MSTMKDVREAKGFSQTDLVRMTGLAPITISRIELGKTRPNYSTKTLIARALDMKPEEIEWPVVTKKG